MDPSRPSLFEPPRQTFSCCDVWEPAGLCLPKKPVARVGDCGGAKGLVFITRLKGWRGETTRGSALWRGESHE